MLVLCIVNFSVISAPSLRSSDTLVPTKWSAIHFPIFLAWYTIRTQIFITAELTFFHSNVYLFTRRLISPVLWRGRPDFSFYQPSYVILGKNGSCIERRWIYVSSFPSIMFLTIFASVKCYSWPCLSSRLLSAPCLSAAASLSPTSMYALSAMSIPSPIYSFFPTRWQL